MKTLNITNNFNAYKAPMVKLAPTFKSNSVAVKDNSQLDIQNKTPEFFLFDEENGQVVLTKVTLPSEKKLFGCFSVEKYDKNNNKRSIELYLNNFGAYSCRLINVEDVKELSERLKRLNKTIETQKDDIKDSEAIDLEIKKAIKHLEKIKTALENY